MDNTSDETIEMVRTRVPLTQLPSNILGLIAFSNYHC